MEPVTTPWNIWRPWRAALIRIAKSAETATVLKQATKGVEGAGALGKPVHTL